MALTSGSAVAATPRRDAAADAPLDPGPEPAPTVLGGGAEPVPDLPTPDPIEQIRETGFGCDDAEPIVDPGMIHTPAPIPDLEEDEDEDDGCMEDWERIPDLLGEEPPDVPPVDPVGSAVPASVSSEPDRGDGIRPGHADVAAGAEPTVPARSPGLESPLGTLVLVVAVSLAWGLSVWWLRLSRDEVLDHDLRSRMLEIVRDEPAINVSQLADRLDVARTTARYHARVLVATDHLVARRTGNGTICYARGRHPPEDKDALQAVRDPTRAALLDVLLESPGLSLAEIGRRLDRDRSTVKHHVDELVDLGLLEARREGRCRRTTVKEGTRESVRRALDPDLRS